MSSKPSKKTLAKAFLKNNFTILPNTPPNSLYSGTLSAVRDIQRTRLPRSRNSSRSKRVIEYINNDMPENAEIPAVYHPWKEQYYPIVTREKFVKSMTKDPYTRMKRLMCHAVENVTTETECCPILIAPENVKSKAVNIQIAPKRSITNTVRYVKRTEPMPSEQFLLPPVNMAKVSAVPKSQKEKSINAVKDTNKLTGITPNLATPNRLLNRAKIQSDASIIRKPPRKLIVNVTHETVMPLSVYG